MGDDCWKWDGEKGVKERFRKVENLHLEGVEESVIGKAGFLDMKSLEGHSKKGMVDLTYTENWHSTQILTLEAAREFGVSFLPIYFARFSLNLQVGFGLKHLLLILW